MAIKELITLEGVEEVKKSLADLGKSGEQFLSQVRESTAGAADPLKSLSTGLESTAQSTEAATGATDRFREGLHLLHPILQAAGVQMSEFTAFSRAAGVGIVGLAAAIGGAVAVALANLEDTAKKTQGTLEDLFGSKALGQQAFDSLRTAANQLGTTVSSVAPGFEALTKAWNTFVESTRTFKFVAPKTGDILPSLGGTSTTVGSVKNLSDAYSNFLKILRAGRLDETEATKEAEAFFKILQDGGKVTDQSLKNLPTGTVQLLAQAFGNGITNAEQFINQVKLVPIPLDKLLEALGRFGQGADEAFNSKAIITYKDTLGEILITLQTGFRSVSGISFSDAVINFLNAVKGTIESTITDINNLIEIWTRFKNLFPSVQPLIGGTGAVPLPLPRPPEAGTGLPSTFKFAPSPEEVKQEIDKIDQEVTPDVEQVGVHWSDALKQPLDETFGQIAGAAIPKMQEIGNSISEGFQSGLDQAKTQFQALYDQAVSIFSNPIQVNFDTSGGFGGQPLGAPFAGGGLVRGPGTSTSDSIWARLSDKEFVLNAKATQFYGAELLYALNALRVPRQFPGFSVGGLVNAMANAMPKFATGGMATAGSPVTIVLDSQRFNMTAPADTVKALSRFSVNRQLSATGRKPSWVK